MMVEHVERNGSKRKFCSNPECSEGKTGICFQNRCSKDYGAKTTATKKTTAAKKTTAKKTTATKTTAAKKDYSY